MSNYFYDMLPADELARLPYIPTVPAFVTWLESNYADMPALCDHVNTYSYKQLGERIAHRRAFIDGIGLPKGANIGVFDRNSADAIELFLAITSAGYTALMLPAGLPAPAIA